MVFFATLTVMIVLLLFLMREILILVFRNGVRMLISDVVGLLNSLAQSFVEYKHTFL